MIRIREEFDADLIKTNLPTEYQTELNHYELLCGVCNKHLFVDEPTIKSYQKALEYNFDNQFTCSECEEEYENLAYEANKIT